MSSSPVSAALAAARAGDPLLAAELLRALMTAELPALGAAAVVRVNTDRYSLNSLNGTVTAADGEVSFFKLHVEEGEERTVEEYYRASLLHQAGWPVELPWFASTAPGRQFLLYRFQPHQRLADALHAAELGSPVDTAALVAAQCSLDAIIGARTISSLHDAPPSACTREAVHQLFHHRLVDPGLPDRLGGRAARFYVGARFDLADGVSLPWSELAVLRWRVNGVLLRSSFGELLEESRRVLEPSRLSDHGAVVAHGDDHNANVWLTPDGLRLFDPAFAGAHIPALLAHVKATFHNVWAHPLWLYDPERSEDRWHVSASVAGGELRVDTDWAPGEVRSAFLESKTEQVWRPLLTALAERGTLPAGWLRVVRCALFCCPTLVMDLRARGPRTNTLGLAVAMLMGAPGLDTPTSVDRWAAHLHT